MTVPYDTEEILSKNIEVITEDSKARVLKSSRIDLSITKDYLIKVISESEEEKEYVVKIKLDKSTNNYLSNIEINKGELEPEFSRETFEYKVNVSEEEDEIEILGIREDERAEILNESSVYSLDSYEKDIVIRVKSEKGSIREYTVKVIKSITRNKKARNIEITKVIEKCEECTLPEYEENTYLYEFSVPYEVDEIGFIVTKNHPNQEIEIIKNNEEVEEMPLLVGENEYRVRVKNSYLEYNEYVYKIERLKNTNNYLKSLRLISPEIEIEEFDKETLEYSVVVGNEYENIEVEALAEDEVNARVSISGTTYLIDGEINDVKIRVRAQNGSMREYIIHVLRTGTTTNLLKTLTVSSGDIYNLSPKFESTIFNYTLSVPSVVGSVQVEGLAKEENAVVEGNGEYNLRLGLNTIKIRVIDENLNEREYTIDITRERGKNVYLSRLEVINGSMSPEFEKTRGLYEVNVSYTEDSLNLEYEPEDELATVKVEGNNNLKYGENEVKIKVTSSDRSAAKTYTLKVIKEGNINNNLRRLEVDEELIEEFDKNKTSYEMEVEYTKDSIEVKGIAEEETSIVSGDGYYSLVEGENNINVNVIAQNGRIKTYTIKVIRKSNTYLSNIVTDRGDVSPEFDKETLGYTLEVENEVEDITVIGLSSGVGQLIEGNGKYNLVVGENYIPIKVSKEGYERTYELVVTRKGSENIYLKYLTIAEGVTSPEFNKTQFNYEVEIPNDITSLSLDYEVEDETSIVEVIGNENFTEDEEEVIIKVTATSGIYGEYKIRVIREDESLFSNKLISLSVDKGTMSPRFDPDTNEYTVSISSNVSGIKIEAEAESEEAIVEGDGNYRIETTRTVIPIVVTSKDRKKRTYTLIVYKGTSKDARLSELEFKEGYLSPGFNKNVYNYTLVADSESKIITIEKIVPVEELATYEIEGNMEARTGNVININVTSPDRSTTKTYKITMKLEKSSNANLKNIRTNIGELIPEFEKGVLTYTVNVSKDTNDIIIESEPENEKAIVEGNGRYELVSGNNYINILVTAETGVTKVYSVIVVKEKSSNNKLKDLYVRGYNISPEFEEETLEYTLEVENEVTEVEVGAELSDIRSSVVGLGKKDLKEGLNEIEVIVVAEDGSIRTYEIDITRKLLSSNKIIKLEIEEGVLSPEFDKDTEEYTVSIPNECNKITETVELEDENATYIVKGNNNLRVGRNKVEIEVTSVEGEKKTYTLNVIRQVSSNNFLQILEVDRGELSPAFEKTKLNYEVEVENSDSEITIMAAPEVYTTSIEGVGTKSLEVGENLFVIKATSASGVERNYQIKVKRKGDNNAYLKSLVLSEGVLSPVFKKETLSYEVELSEVEKLEITGEADSEKAEVIGLKEYDIKPGENNIDITVTAEDGSIKIYHVKVTRTLSSNKKILNIIPSEGTLSPTFNDSIEEYEINIGKDTNIVNFEVETESKNAKVKGNEGIVVDTNRKEVTIEVEAEDKTKREITIIINKTSEYTGLEVEEKDILILKGEEYTLNVRTTPEGGRITYESEDESIAKEENGKIVGKGYGNTIIKVKVDGVEGLEKEVQVTVVREKIESEEYDVLQKEDKIVVGAKAKTKIKDFKNNLLNHPKTIKIYDKEENEVDDESIVKTGLIIKLEYNDKTYDEAIMIVKGDLNEDGIVDVSDKVVLQNHVLGKQVITDYRKYAEDVEIDEIIDVTDNVKLGNYILGKINSFN